MTKTPPLWSHQKQAAEEALLYPKRALFWSPRLGKTNATIQTIKAWSATRGVVVAPLLVCPMWSQLLSEAGFTVTNGYSGTLEARRTRCKSAGDSIIILNYDAATTLLDTLLRWGPKFVVADESHWIKSPSAKRAKAVRRLCWNTDYVRLLTGTPAPNHYGELWGQMTCIDPDEWSKAYTKFATRHLIRDSFYPSRIVGYNDLERINRLTTSSASIVRREDVFGPDTYQFVTRSIQLPPTAATMYRKLAKQWVLDEEGVTAEHILKRLVRLQQLTSGYLPSDDGQSVIGTHTAKIDAVMADLGEIVESGEKAVIFHRFRWEGELYAKQIAESFPQAYAGKIDGSVGVESRATLVADFNSSPGARVMVIQTQSGGIGISLAESSHALFVSSDFSFVDHKQAIDRIYKPGARRVVTSYVCAGTIDEFIEESLNRKESIHTSITHADRQSIAFGTGAKDG